MSTTPVRPDVPVQPPNRSSTARWVPVQPPKKKTHKGLWITLAVIALLIVAGYATDDSPTESNSNDAESEARIAETIGDAPEFAISAELVVDTMDSATVEQFCTGYFNVGDYDLAFEAFRVGYSEPDPSAEEVFDELLTRC